MQKIYLSELLEGRGIKDQRFILKRFYDDAYAAGVYDPKNGKSTWESMSDNYNVIYGKCLDVGCGSGSGVACGRLNGWELYGCDIADAIQLWKENNVGGYCVVAEARTMPYKDKEFGFVSCTDVLEHVPEFDMPDTLKEIRRVCSKMVFLGIGLKEEVEPVKGVIYTHITLKPVEWWRSQIEAAGFKIASLKDQKHHLAVWGSCD